MFYTSFLKLYDQIKEGNMPSLPFIKVNSEEKFEVEEIFNSWIWYSKL